MQYGKSLKLGIRVCLGLSKFCLVLEKMLVYRRELTRMEVVKNKFGQLSHEGNNVYVQINSQVYVLPNLCDQLGKID